MGYIEKNPNKEISILLGAGFSKSLANLPLAKELSSKVLEAFKSNAKWKNKFENIEEGNFNYEKFSQYLECVRDQDRLAKELNIKFSSLDEDEIEQLNLCRTILSKTLLQELLSVDYSKELKERQGHFIKLIKELINEGYKLHFFDLNHDLLLARLFEENKLPVEDFFEHYTENELPNQGYIVLKEDAKSDNISQKKFRKSSKKINEQGVSLLRSKEPLSSYDHNNTKIFHYKPHGALNFIYLQRLRVEGNPPRYMTWLHQFKNFKRNGDTNYGASFNEHIKDCFNNRSYPTEQGNIRCQPAILNQGWNKASILTRDFLDYFPEVYSKFISLGEKGVPLLTIGYGFQDSHFNTAIMHHYRTQIYTAYEQLAMAKILFSGYNKIPLITDRLESISVSDAGLTRNEFGRTVICSEEYFEIFLRLTSLT